jgi:PurA ssDNA and RNA-binding protein
LKNGMISNERPSPYRPRSHSSAPRTNAPEDTLKTERLQIERKTFVFVLKENTRGRFLRITEDANGRRDTIIVPAAGFEEFQRQFERMVKTSADTPQSYER